MKQFLWLHANVIGLLGRGTHSLGTGDFAKRLEQEHLTEAEQSALLKVLEQMGYESEERQEELYHYLVELLIRK